MKKNILILPCSLLLFAGCSSTSSNQTANRNPSSGAQVGIAGYSENRVEGQKAREAGLADDRWRVKRSTLVTGSNLITDLAEAENAAPKTEELAQGTASAGERGTTVVNGSGGLETMDHADIELRKEELVVGKREVSNGGVLIRTVVQTENVSQPIDLRREEYVIERVPANDVRNRSDADASASNAFQGREIYIPLMREEPVTSKRTLLTESVKVGKKIETDRQTITRPVRTEDVEIVKNPDLAEARFSSVPRRSAASNGRESAPVDAATQGETSADTLKLAKEEFIVGKRDVDNGGVFLQKVVRTQDASQPVELRREEFTIDRTSLGNQPVVNSDFRERAIKINLTREEPVAGTRNYLAETIRVRKQIQTDKQTVSGTVRKETVEIVKNSDQSATGQGGTGNSIQTGTSSLSESGYPAKSPEKTSDESK